MCPGSPCTALGRGVQSQIHFADHPRIAALVGAFFVVEPTVAFLSDFNDFIAAEGTLRSLEAVALLAVLDRIQHVGDVPHGTGGKLAIVRPIAAGGTGEHDVVTVDSSRATFGRVIMLMKQIRNQFI